MRGEAGATCGTRGSPLAAPPRPRRRRACRLLLAAFNNAGPAAPPPRAPRQFLELADPGGPHPGLLQDVLAKHAQPLVSHVLAALATAGARDADLAGALLEALLLAASAAHFVPELAADRCGGGGGALTGSMHACT